LGVFLGLAGVAVGLFSLAKVVAVHERVFEGKSAAQWRAELSSGDAGRSQRASVVLNTTIIPELTDAALHDTNESRFKPAVAEFLNDLPGVRLCYLEAPARRGDAVKELGKFGPAAKAAVPVLLQILKGHDAATRSTAATVLGEIKSDPDVVIPALIGCLGDADLEAEAADALGDFGPLAKAAVPKLLPLLHGDKEARHAANHALRKIDPIAAAKAGVRPPLIESLNPDGSKKN
jgi:HEAT repeat protein